MQVFARTSSLLHLLDVTMGLRQPTGVTIDSVEGGEEKLSLPPLRTACIKWEQR